MPHGSRFGRGAPLSAAVGWEGDHATLVLSGELDLGTLPTAERALAEIEVAGARRVTLDLRSVDFLDLSGLRLLFGAYDRWGGGLRVGRPSPPVDDLLQFSGLAERLHLPLGGRFHRS